VSWIRSLLGFRFGDPPAIRPGPEVEAAARKWLSLRAQALDLGSTNFQLATLWLAAVEGFLSREEVDRLEGVYRDQSRQYLEVCRAETKARRVLEGLLRRGERYQVDGRIFGFGAAPHDHRVLIYPYGVNN
jgi:hypothetical protein